MNNRLLRRETLYWSCAALILSIALAGCEYVRPTLNEPLKEWNPDYGYKFRNLAPPEEGNSDSLLISASFSGGGVRASALRELARHQILWEGKQKRLLDELDFIYALSGGTSTGAYYALFGERIFHDFEYRFLRKDWESELKARILRSPSNWFRLWSPYYGRAHIMAELLDEALFDGKTYGDLVRQQSRPGILIHASDMATLAIRVSPASIRSDLFGYESTADRLCVRCLRGPSAGPEPDYVHELCRQLWLQATSVDVEGKQVGKHFQRQRAKELLSYMDAEKRPQVHLLDGGLSDNVALRGILEGVGVVGGLEAIFKNAGVKQVKKLVILSVNAETSPDVKEYRSDEVPVFSRAFSSMVDIPINRYSADSLLLMRFAVEKWRQEIRSRPPGMKGALAPDAEIYFIDASLGAVDDPVEQEYLMKIPTTLYLTDEQIDRLLTAASRLIYKDPEFQRLMTDLQRGP